MKSVKTLWLIRHGQSRSQTGEEHWEDPDLSDLGIRQARALRGLLQDEPFDHARISPLRRARETYRLSGANVADAAFDSRIAECTFGGRYESILPYRTPPWAAADAADAWHVPAARRAAEFLADLRALPGERILVVGHWAIFSLLVLTVLGVTDPQEPLRDQTRTTAYLENAALAELTLGHPRFGDSLLRWNDRSHLDGLS